MSSSNHLIPNREGAAAAASRPDEAEEGGEPAQLEIVAEEGGGGGSTRAAAASTADQVREKMRALRKRHKSGGLSRRASKSRRGNNQQIAPNAISLVPSDHGGVGAAEDPPARDNASVRRSLTSMTTAQLRRKCRDLLGVCERQKKLIAKQKEDISELNQVVAAKQVALEEQSNAHCSELKEMREHNEKERKQQLAEAADELTGKDARISALTSLHSNEKKQLHIQLRKLSSQLTEERKKTNLVRVISLYFR